MNSHAQWKDFRCLRCGKCCTDIGLPFDSQRIGEIARFLGLSVDEVIEKYYGRFTEDLKSWISQAGKRTPCPFLTTIDDNKTACDIYPVRPGACRQFPFDSVFGPHLVDCPAAKLASEKKQNDDIPCCS